MKLTKNEKNLRKIMRDGFMSEGGLLFPHKLAGMIVAVRPCIGSESRFCEVSLAFCDFAEDTWNRKRGEFVVLQKWERGEFVVVPLEDGADLVGMGRVADMFFEMFGE
jgi:hypothetical protein